MSRRLRLVFWCVAAGLAIATARHLDPALNPPPDHRPALAGLVRTPDRWRPLPGRVTHVTDGDTFRLDDGTVIRVVGVDSPEIGHNGRPSDPGGDEASDWARRTLLGQRVTCYVHPDNAHDRFGRVPALVFTDGDGLCFDIELLRAGHARVRYLHFSPDVRAERFEAAERRR